MMSSAEASVEIYENERAWIGGGFGKKGLLPNDRGRFSSVDGSIAWKTIEEAQVALLEKGWSYLEDDSFTLEEGSPEWWYARDFTHGAMANAKNNRNAALHWVRFRRLVRKKLFDADQFVPKEIYSLCDHCDSEATTALSQKILDVLAYITLVQSPSVLTDAVALPTKAKILVLLDYRLYTQSRLDARLDALHKALENLADEERNQTKHIFSNVGEFYQRHLDPAWQERCKDVTTRFLTRVERDVISGLLVRALDPDFQLHCNKVNCGDSCEFARVPCPNEGCPTVLSKIYLPVHDDKCPYKKMSCSCGDEFQRQQNEHHLAEICPLRELKCPFEKIGCAKVLQAKDVPDHVAEETSAHLLLALNRMMEFQTVVRGMNGKIQQLEEENTRLKQMLDEFRVGAAKETLAVDKKVVAMGKKLNTLEHSSRKEFKKIHDTERQMQRSHLK